MQVPKTTIKRKKGAPQVNGEFCPFTLKIKIATLEQAAALRALNGAMTLQIAAGISESVLFYPTPAEDVVRASDALNCIHCELIKQGVPHG